MGHGLCCYVLRIVKHGRNSLRNNACVGSRWFLYRETQGKGGITGEMHMGSSLTTVAVHAVYYNDCNDNHMRKHVCICGFSCWRYIGWIRSSKRTRERVHMPEIELVSWHRRTKIRQIKIKKIRCRLNSVMRRHKGHINLVLCFDVQWEDELTFFSFQEDNDYNNDHF